MDTFLNFDYNKLLLVVAGFIAGFKSKGVSIFPFSIYCGISTLLGFFKGASNSNGCGCCFNNF